MSDSIVCSECYLWGRVHCDAKGTAGDGLELRLASDQETQAVKGSLFMQDSGLRGRLPSGQGLQLGQGDGEGIRVTEPIECLTAK